jgi:hypothetical protein
VRRPPFLAVAAGLVTLACIIGPASQASAAGPTPTVLGLSPHSQEVTYTSNQINFSGQLLSDTDGQGQGLPGQQVTLTLRFDNQLGSVELGTVTTGTDGDFSLQATLPVPGFVLAQFAGNSAYAASSSTLSVFDLSPTFAEMPARVLVNPISPVPVYSDATVTGQVQMQLPDGSWIPSPYAPISIMGSGVATPPYANVNGDFAVSFYAVFGEEYAVLTNGNGFAWSGSASSAPLTIPLSVFATQLTSFAAPGSSLPDMTFSASPEYANSQGEWLPLAGAQVRLYYQALRSSQWILRGTGTSSAYGVTIRDVSGFLPGGSLASGTGVWEMRLVGSSTYLASVSNLLSVNVTVPVWINHAATKHSGGRSYLTGVLDDRRHSGPVAGQRIMLYWHGRRIATAQTNAAGEFSFAMSGRPYGSYQVRYSGGKLAGGGGRYVPATRGVSVTYRT